MDPYLVGIAALLVAAVVVRMAGSRRPAVLDLAPEAAGYLAAGPRRAVRTAVGVLRLSGAVSVATTGKIKRTGTAPAHLDPLSAAVFAALETPATASVVQRQPGTRGRLGETRAELAAQGLVVGTTSRTALGVLSGAVLVLGLARPAEQPLGWLNLTIIAASTATAVTLWRTARRTRTGTHTLRVLRDHFPVADGELSPRVGGMMVALHGRLDLAGIENLTARPRRRRRTDTGHSDHGHYNPPGQTTLNDYGAP